MNQAAKDPGSDAEPSDTYYQPYRAVTESRDLLLHNAPSLRPRVSRGEFRLEGDGRTAKALAELPGKVATSSFGVSTC